MAVTARPLPVYFCMIFKDLCGSRKAHGGAIVATVACAFVGIAGRHGALGDAIAQRLSGRASGGGFVRAAHAKSVDVARADLPAIVPESAATEPRVHGKNRSPYDATPVVVDGAVRGFLRHSELPAGLSNVSRGAGTPARFFRLDRYLAALGVPVSEVTAVHFLGNRGRVASVSGAELRKEPARFVFDFTLTTAGTPSVMWDTAGLANEKRIDFIAAMGVFVRTPAPRLDPTWHCYRTDDGCDERAPFVPREGVRGTRVYRDGRLVGTVKRRTVDDGSTLGALLSAMGAGSPAAVALVAEDEVALHACNATVEGARCAGQQATADVLGRPVAAPRHGHGAVVVDIEGAQRQLDAIFVKSARNVRNETLPQATSRTTRNETSGGSNGHT